MFNIEKIREFEKQYTISNNKLMQMISTEDSEDNWFDNYHLIDHDRFLQWKEMVNNLDKDNYEGYKSNKSKYFEKDDYININGIDESENKNKYLDSKGKNTIDPTKMKSFDIISYEAWELFNNKNENSNFKGKIFLKKGNRKIIIKFDENNYCIKYLKNDKNLFGEFLLIFNTKNNSFKKKVIDDVSKSDIYKWMKKIEFKYDSKRFTVNKYGNENIPFDVEQKSNNYCKDDIPFNFENNFIKETAKYISFSNTSFSFACNSIENNSNFSFLHSSEFINYFSEAKNYRKIKKFERTTGIIEVMRCFSMIDPLADYFMSNIRRFRIFSNFQSKSLLNIIRDFFLNFWSNEKTPFLPKELTRYIKEQKKINISEEQDPIIFLNDTINYINDKLNKVDKEFNFNFNDIVKEKEKEHCSYLEELKSICDKYNSISGKCFYGLMLYTYECNNSACKKETEKVEAFNMIELEYKKIINSLMKNDEGYSFDETDIDFFLKYYFLQKKTKDIKSLCIDCPKCGNKAEMIKKEILEYPEYLIIKLDQGKLEKNRFKDSFEISIDIDYAKIIEISNNSGKNINFEYKLISMIKYCYYGEKLYFVSICKSPISLIKNVWISFLCDSDAKELLQDYKNDYSKPYILFYKLEKIKK